MDSPGQGDCPYLRDKGPPLGENLVFDPWVIVPDCPPDPWLFRGVPVKLPTLWGWRYSEGKFWIKNRDDAWVPLPDLSSGIEGLPHSEDLCVILDNPAGGRP